METKLKIKTVETKEVEKEIQLPYFFKKTYSNLRPTYYAIFDSERSMKVDPDRPEIDCIPSKVVADGLSDENISQSSESEFTEAFETTIEALTAMMPVSI